MVSKLQKCFFEIFEMNFLLFFHRCLSRGSCHQGDLENGGKQCTCIALSFLVGDNIPKKMQDIDDILEKGTAL